MKHTRIPHAQTRKANRDLLVCAARHVFATKGYEAANIRDIVRESGLSQGSFYNNFKDKREVFEIVMNEIVEPLAAELRTVRASSRSAKEFLWSAFHSCVQLAIKNPETSAIIARCQGEFRPVFYLSGNNTQIRNDLVSDLREGMETGRFCTLMPEMTADSMMSLGFDLVIHCASCPEEAEVRVSYLTDLFLPMLTKS
ncbi:TetR/AcrR family transcriptional regulator [Pseudophaeobacter leonis]|uniref:TetR/AcrR family transcriptional regulator n=1 Tax=Pseudophaeobacter leonis TaxID=1144477 RepID=UPI0013747F3B|nr:TetR/AcrR family transcriptional regulator [Pseudophaeobacter leonis]